MSPALSTFLILFLFNEEPENDNDKDQFFILPLELFIVLCMFLIGVAQSANQGGRLRMNQIPGEGGDP